MCSKVDAPVLQKDRFDVASFLRVGTTITVSGSLKDFLAPSWNHPHKKEVGLPLRRPVFLLHGERSGILICFDGGYTIFRWAGFFVNYRNDSNYAEVDMQNVISEIGTLLSHPHHGFSIYINEGVMYEKTMPRNSIREWEPRLHLCPTFGRA